MKIILVIFLTLLLVTPLAMADRLLPDRQQALARIDQNRAELLATELQAALSGQNATVSRQLLDTFLSDNAGHLPEAELALWKLTEAARLRTAGELDPYIFKYLTHYTSRSRYRHPESATASLPLFNIRASASGVLRLQQRQRDLLEARALPPVELLDHYLRSPAVSRHALRQAIIELDSESRRQLLSLGRQKLTVDSPGLSRLLAELALIEDDQPALRQLLTASPAAELPELLALIHQRLPQTASHPLLLHASEGPAETAAIAIHYLGLAVDEDAGIYARLLDWLTTKRTGAAAALALSGSRRPELLADLNALTQRGNPVLSRYARLAQTLAEESK